MDSKSTSVHKVNVVKTNARKPDFQNDLLNQNTLYRVIEAMPIGVYIMDETEKIIYANQAGKNIWKGIEYVGPDEFRRYRGWWPDTGEEISPSQWAGSRAVQKGEVTIDEEIRIQCFDGSSKIIANSALPLINEAGGIYGAIALNRDITNRKKNEKKIRESELLFRTTLDHLLEGVQIIDYDWRYVYINDAAQTHNQRPREDLIGKRYTDKWTGIEKTPLFSVLQRCLEERKAHKFETQFHFKNGEMGWFDFSIQPVPKGILILSVDTTHRKQSESERHRKQRLDSLGFLAAGIAHDFNNLFGGIYGTIDLAIESSGDTNVKSYLNKSMETIHRARGLTQQLITFAKGGTPRRTQGSLFPRLIEITNNLLLDSRIGIRYDIASDLWECQFDATQIGQAIGNIIQNCIDACALEDEIQFSASNTNLCNSNSGLPDGNYAEICISDTGKGISSDTIGKVFDPFFTTHETGRGLGLSTCYSIIKQHKGAIQIYSKLGHGTTVHIHLPAVNSQNDAQLCPSIKYSPAQERILLMDDEEIIRIVTSAMLTKLGYEVVVAREGKEAFDLFQSAHSASNAFKAIILDLTVPSGWGGEKTVAQIRNIDKKIPIFVSSGYVDVPIMIDSTAYGFTDNIKKPFSTKELSDLFAKHTGLPNSDAKIRL